ncbi:hypothetical protein [Parafrankia elaeagni]|uniref:hypothetical protein n=1 Tax=Parafrankia elaeagni TaxID=222534 RepID=UPI0003827AC2|nr:hypothetical protein [Parafrankia elaeagni]
MLWLLLSLPVDVIVVERALGDASRWPFLLGLAVLAVAVRCRRRLPRAALATSAEPIHAKIRRTGYNGNTNARKTGWRPAMAAE